MIVGDISELKVMGVYDRDTPNQERICIIVNEPINMGQFGLILGIRQEGSVAVPIRDNFFWFGDGHVYKDDWIFVYTGPGETRIAEIPGSTGKLYSLHWGRDKTILHHPELVPILIRVDAVDVYAEMPALLSVPGQKA